MVFFRKALLRAESISYMTTKLLDGELLRKRPNICLFACLLVCLFVCLYCLFVSALMKWMRLTPVMAHTRKWISTVRIFFC